MYRRQMELFQDGGEVDEVSGNDIPLGSTAKEVRDDQPAMLSEGEMVVPADVVRYFGVEHFMNLRDQAKLGYKKMEAMGQFGTDVGKTLPDDTIFNAGGAPFTIEDIEVVEIEEDYDDDDKVKASSGALVRNYADGGPVPLTGRTPMTARTPLIPDVGRVAKLPEKQGLQQLTGSTGMGTFQAKYYMDKNNEIHEIFVMDGLPTGFIDPEWIEIDSPDETRTYAQLQEEKGQEEETTTPVQRAVTQVQDGGGPDPGDDPSAPGGYTTSFDSLGDWGRAVSNEITNVLDDISRNVRGEEDTGFTVRLGSDFDRENLDRDEYYDPPAPPVEGIPADPDDEDTEASITPDPDPGGMTGAGSVLGGGDGNTGTGNTGTGNAGTGTGAGSITGPETNEAFGTAFSGSGVDTSTTTTTTGTGTGNANNVVDQEALSSGLGLGGGTGNTGSTVDTSSGSNVGNIGADIGFNDDVGGGGGTGGGDGAGTGSGTGGTGGGDTDPGGYGGGYDGQGGGPDSVGGSTTSSMDGGFDVADAMGGDAGGDTGTSDTAGDSDGISDTEGSGFRRGGSVRKYAVGGTTDNLLLTGQGDGAGDGSGTGDTNLGIITPYQAVENAMQQELPENVLNVLSQTPPEVRQAAENFVNSNYEVTDQTTKNFGGSASSSSTSKDFSTSNVGRSMPDGQMMDINSVGAGMISPNNGQLTGSLSELANTISDASVQNLQEFANLKNSVLGNALLDVLGIVTQYAINPAPGPIAVVQGIASMLSPEVAKGFNDLKGIPQKEAAAAGRMAVTMSQTLQQFNDKEKSQLGLYSGALALGLDPENMAPNTDVVAVQTNNGIQTGVLSGIPGQGFSHVTLANGDIVGTKSIVGTLDRDILDETKANHSFAVGRNMASIAAPSPEVEAISKAMSPDFGIDDTPDTTPDYGGMTGAESVLGGGDADPGGMTGAGAAGAGGYSSGSDLEGYSDTGGFDEGGGDDGGASADSVGESMGAESPEGNESAPGDFKRGGFVHKRKTKKKKKKMRRGLAGR